MDLRATYSRTTQKGKEKLKTGEKQSKAIATFTLVKKFFYRKHVLIHIDT